MIISLLFQKFQTDHWQQFDIANKAQLDVNTHHVFTLNLNLLLTDLISLSIQMVFAHKQVLIPIILDCSELDKLKKIQGEGAIRLG